MLRVCCCVHTLGVWIYWIVNYISVEFIFKEKKLNEISENKFSLIITCYMICVRV